MAPPPVRDTRKQQLLAWALEKEERGSDGSWPAASDDKKQRLLQRRREIMAAPGLESMKRKHQDGEEDRDEHAQREMEGEMEGDAGEMEGDTDADNQDRDEYELKERVDDGETSLSPRSSLDGNASDGNNQHSEPGVSDGEDDRSLEQEEDAFEEAMTHPEEAEADDLSGSYFALDAADVQSADGQPLYAFDDEQKPEDQDEEPALVRRTIENVDVSVNIHRSVETVVEPVSLEEPSQSLAHAFPDDGASLVTEDSRATALSSQLDGAPTLSTRPKKSSMGWCRFFLLLLVSTFTLAGAVVGAMVWHDPTSPLARVVKDAAAVAAMTFGSKTVAVAHWAEVRVHQPFLAPVVEKLALALAYVAEESSHWSAVLSSRLKAVVADEWSGLKAHAGAASNKCHSLYHSVVDKVADTCATVKDDVVDWWMEHIHGEKFSAGDSAAELGDPLADERVRMAAIKQQLDYQEAWVLKELERMKSRRAAYSSATDSLLSESKSLVSDSIHDAKDAAVRRIKSFSEQIAAALKGSGSFHNAVGTAAPEAHDASHHEPEHADQSAEPFHVTEDGDDGAKTAASVPSLNVKDLDVAESKADTVSIVQGAETAVTMDAASDTASHGVSTGQTEEASKPLTDVEAQQDEAAALAALGLKVGEQPPADANTKQVENVEAEERVDGAPDSDAASVRDELERIAKEEELELGVATVKVATELLKTGAEIEEDTLLLRDQLDAARAVAESEAVGSVCSDAHCLTESDAIERLCEDAQCIAESEAAERVCDGVRCAAQAVEHVLHDIGEHIRAETQNDVEVGGLVEPGAHIPDVVEPEVADITSMLLPSGGFDATASSLLPNPSLAHLVPMATMSTAFLSVAAASGYYLRRAWRLRQQRIARHERWRRRCHRKQWQRSADGEEEDEVEEVVLISGPSSDTGEVESESEDRNGTSGTSAGEEIIHGAEDEGAEPLGDEEETESDEEDDSSGPSDQPWVPVVESTVEVSDVTASSVSDGVKASGFVRVTRHAAQRVLSYSPDSAAASGHNADSDEAM